MNFIRKPDLLNMSDLKLILTLCFIFALGSCGDDPSPEPASPSVDSSTEVTPVDSEPDGLEDSLPSESLVEDLPEEEQKEAPDPNGIFLPLYESKDGKMEMTKLNNFPVYSNGKGYFLWTNGSLWKITTKAGSGRSIASGGESLLEGWSTNVQVRFSPDEEYSKQAMFRLAVAFQGSQDNENAIRLFNQFVTLFPEDKLVAEVYLSMGDLATSGLGPDIQPNIKQIRQAIQSYSKVRENTQDIGLISDSTANQGGLLERVGENPEGLVTHFLTFDKDSDKCLSEGEVSTLRGDLGESFPFVFKNHDLN